MPPLPHSYRSIWHAGLPLSLHRIGDSGAQVEVATLSSSWSMGSLSPAHNSSMVTCSLSPIFYLGSGCGVCLGRVSTVASARPHSELEGIKVYVGREKGKFSSVLMYDEVRHIQALLSEVTPGNFQQGKRFVDDVRRAPRSQATRHLLSHGSIKFGLIITNEYRRL